jgi:hypothetical protein
MQGSEISEETSHLVLEELWRERHRRQRAQLRAAEAEAKLEAALVRITRLMDGGSIAGAPKPLPFCSGPQDYAS